MARSIQQASLPKEVPSLEGWQISPFLPASQRGGRRLHDFHPISKGSVGVVVGDATGRGVPAALVMSTTCGMLQAVSRALGSPPFAWGGARAGQRDVVGSHPSQHVRHASIAILEPQSGA